jgi:uncharacterized protein (TIGR03790 family)
VPAALALALAAPGRGADAAGDSPDGLRTVVVANADLAPSLEVARHYCAGRAIPAENVIAIRCSAEEEIGWPEFAATIWNPVLDALLAREWLAAGGRTGPDAAGRCHPVGAASRLHALVTVWGVPVRIRHDGRLTADPNRTNRAAVDSELALLAAGGHPIELAVPNALFRERVPGAAPEPVIVVSRLDGPDAAAACRLADSALEGERRGLWGRAYIDTGGPWALGDQWLGRAGNHLADAGFQVVRDEPSTVFAQDARFDRPAFYLGWYRRHVEGVFLRPGFAFPAGAVAMHIHSNSALPVRSRTEGWVGPLVERGAALTCGNVYEPYLARTHRPDILAGELLAGRTAGEAAWAALPAASWSAIAIGDPLYRPFPGGVRALAARAAASGDPWAAVVAAGMPGSEGGAAAVLARAWERTPHPVLALEMLIRAATETERALAAERIVLSDWALAAGEPGLLPGAAALLRSWRLEEKAALLEARLPAPPGSVRLRERGGRPDRPRGRRREARGLLNFPAWAPPRIAGAHARPHQPAVTEKEAVHAS